METKEQAEQTIAFAENEEGRTGLVVEYPKEKPKKPVNKTKKGKK